MPLQWMMSWVFLTAIAAGAVRADSVKDGGRVLFVGAGWTEQHGYAAMAQAASPPREGAPDRAAS